jgi:hypothetical protein
MAMTATKKSRYLREIINDFRNAQVAAKGCLPVPKAIRRPTAITVEIDTVDMLWNKIMTLLLYGF